MTRPSLAPLESLRALAAHFPVDLNPSELPELESTPQSLALIARGGPLSLLVDALYSYWIDYDNRYLYDAGLLARALLHTAELVAAHPVTEDWSVDESETLSRAFRALLRRRPAIALAVGEQAFVTLGQALHSTVERLRVGVDELTRPALCWVELFNTLIIVWPEQSCAAFDRLAAPTPKIWRSWLQYVSVLAFPSTDHPLWSEPTLLWRRFGQEFGLRWTTDQRPALSAALGTARLRDGLAALVEWASPVEHERVGELTRDIIDFLLDTDLRQRRAILLEQLLSKAPADHWPDEYGGG